MASLSPGQRVLVEFGRSRTVGFYLATARPDPRIVTKPVIQALDTISFFPPDLFQLCCWIADYYFANPADCLAAALPPMLKTRRSVGLHWAANVDLAILPDQVRSFCRPGKAVGKEALDSLKRGGMATLSELIAGGVLVEQWPVAGIKTAPKIDGYRVADPEGWTGFFAGRRFKPEPFAGTKSRAQLTSSGWTDYYFRQAVQAGMLEAVFTQPKDRILDFVKPRPGVAELQPNEGQRRAIEAVGKELENGFQSFLLHGITGSGKTLVYCQLVSQVLERGRTALVLTPEIALAGTTLSYFRGFFGSLVTVIHSAMTQRERLESWNGIRSGKYRVVVGPRSAVFAPLEKLGLIVVDEEHDGSYKQDDPAPRFHGRDCAVMRAKINDIPVLLGSASPSLESYQHARSGRYRLLELTERPQRARLPRVRVVNMRTERLKGDLPYLSFALKKEADTRLEASEQVILFLNRRGYSPQIKCADCGHVPSCPHCNIKLTYHKAGRKLSCHYCGYVRGGIETCESCGGSDFLYIGAGTQKIEEHMARLFKNVRVMRFDSDTASGRKNAHRMLYEFADRQYDLLLGTQMVTKGLDLPGVTLVGVLSADLGLDLPDFRASEKTFARLLQVAGRCGRGHDPGEVIIQTFYPESWVIQDAARQDYRGFFEREIESRRALGFPPFSRLVKFSFSSADEGELLRATARFAEALVSRAGVAGVAIDRLGPAPCPIPFLRGKHRRQLLVKTGQVRRVSRLMAAWENEQARFGLPSKVKITVDVDPDDLM